MRKLASAVIIDEIVPIPGADRLEIARVGGWVCGVRKGDFRPGDVAVYFEIDSFLPESDPRWASFCARGTNKMDVDGREVIGHKVKTVKLRGALSQGLLLSFEALQIPPVEPGTDLTDTLGILKWEPPMVGPALKQGNPAGDFPSHLIPKTDAERVQNLPPEWLAAQDPDNWFATEKIDGTSLTVIRTSENEVIVCSRNLRITEGDNTYWDAARKLLPDIDPGVAVQAEIYGAGIQGNPLNLPDKRVAVFLVARTAEAGPFRYTPHVKWGPNLIGHAVPTYSHLTLLKTRAEILTQSDGLRSLINPDRLAEGIVWQHRGAIVHPELGRPVFKAINNQYLLKQG
jgi:RNA ligase (TIGR02306 family)